MNRLLVGAWLAGAGIAILVSAVSESLVWLYPLSATLACVGFGVLVKADRA